MENKYLKYKSKYLNIKNMYGGMVSDFPQYDVYMVLQRKSEEEDKILSVAELLEKDRLTKIGNVEHQTFNLDSDYKKSISRLPLVITTMEKILEYIYFNNTPYSDMEPISFTCKGVGKEYINIHILKKEQDSVGTKYFIYQKSDCGGKLLILITTYKSHGGLGGRKRISMKEDATTIKTFLTTIKDIQKKTKEDYIKHFQSANEKIKEILKLVDKDDYIKKLISEYKTKTETETETKTIIYISKIIERDYIKKLKDNVDDHDNIKSTIEDILDCFTKLKTESNIHESMYKNIKICEYIEKLKFNFELCKDIEKLNKIKEYIYYTGILNNIKEYHDKAIIDDHGYNNFTDIQLIDETNINTIRFLLPRS